MAADGAARLSDLLIGTELADAARLHASPRLGRVDRAA
jgi:hypothetical protein